MAALAACLVIGALAAEPGAVTVERWGHSFYFPASARARPGRIPLVVYLHGCSQPRWHSEKTTALHGWAETARFAVLMPEQTRLRNGWKCWNWFLGRDALEMNEVVSLVREYQERFPLSRTRTHVMGLSAGGVLAAHLLACRSNVFRGGVVASGAAFRMLHPPTSLEDVGASGHAPAALSRLAHGCMQDNGARRPVSVLVIHGERDLVSRPRNGEQVALQFAGANRLLAGTWPGDDEAFRVDSEEVVRGSADRHAYRVTRFPEVDGARVVLVRVRGMGHAWSGGPSWLPFSDGDGPDATRMGLEFLGLITHEPPATAP